MTLFGGVLFVALGIFIASDVSNQLDSLFRSTAQTLSQSLQTGDGFQIRKILGSFTESGSVAGAAIYDATGNKIATYGQLETATSPFIFKSGQIFLSKRYHFNGPGSMFLGSMLLQRSVSPMPFVYLLLLTGILSLILVPLIRGEISAFGRRLIRPVEALPSRLFRASSLKEAEEQDQQEQVDELYQVYRRLDDLIQKESDLILAQDDIKQKEKLLWISSQVAHDIRSPLSTIQVLFPDLAISNSRKSGLIRHALHRIDNLTQDLLAGAFIRAVAQGAGQPFSLTPDTASKTSLKDLIPAIGQLIEEKRALKPSTGKAIVLHFEHPQDLQDITARGALSQIQRITSNLISNSMEAIANEGSIAAPSRCSAIALRSQCTILVRASPQRRS